MKESIFNSRNRLSMIRKAGSMYLLCFIVGIGFSMFLNCVNHGNCNHFIDINLKISANHPAISINGNLELDTFCAGKGTDGLSWDTAHVIENLEIDAGDNPYGIQIIDTTRFLIIKNCIVLNACIETIINKPAGIHLAQTKNVKVIKCEINNNLIGIWLQSLNENTISDNKILFNDEDGIEVDGSRNNVTGNYCSRSMQIGISVERGENNIISNNEASFNRFFGIKVGGNKNFVNNNNASYNEQYGISISSESDNNEIYDNIVCFNQLGGINDLGENNDVYDNDECTQSEVAILSYPIIIILWVMLCGVSILSCKMLKNRKIKLYL